MQRSPNRYFNTYNFGPTQKLIEDLIIEAIQVHGTWVWYMPRTKTNVDAIFGEDSLSKFEDAVQIEMYLKNFESFEGQGKLLSKFGVEIRDEVTLVVARKRFEQSRADHILLETGDIWEQETTNRYHAFQTNGFLMEAGDSYIAYNRPREGDLIYIPLLKKAFEIKYTQTDAIFFQGGALQVFDLSCELFEYSNEEFNTGYAPLDSIEDIFSSNRMNDLLTLEDGTAWGLEGGGSMLLEDQLYVVDPSANNETFAKESTNIIDFSDISPFILQDKNLKW